MDISSLFAFATLALIFRGISLARPTASRSGWQLRPILIWGGSSILLAVLIMTLAYTVGEPI